MGTILRETLRDYCKVPPRERCERAAARLSENGVPTTSIHVVGTDEWSLSLCVPGGGERTS